jgi:hypothetical protein
MMSGQVLGLQRYGQLGDSTTIQRLPAMLVGASGAPDNYRRLHSCALTTTGCAMLGQ